MGSKVAFDPGLVSFFDPVFSKHFGKTGGGILSVGDDDEPGRFTVQAVH